MSRDTDRFGKPIDRNQQRRWEEAANWYVTFQDTELSDQLVKSWLKWEEVPENRKAFDRVERVWCLAGAVSNLPPVSPEERAADHYDGLIPVSVWRSARAGAQSTQPKRRRFTVKLVLLAAASVGVVLAVQWMLM